MLYLSPERRMSTGKNPQRLVPAGDGAGRADGTELAPALRACNRHPERALAITGV